jgi:uncharacterized repeat protein (TIGR03803 family)
MSIQLNAEAAVFVASTAHRDSSPRPLKNALAFIVVVTGIFLDSTSELAAQTLTTLHSFAETTDGDSPMGNLILSGNTLYGTTAYGGDFDVGTVFAMNTDGTGFRTIHNFSGTNEGAAPQAALTLSGNVLYGTTTYGGSWNWGTVFAVNTDGTGFTNLHSFDGQHDGGYPYSTLAFDGNTLYGTTADVLGVGAGTVFRINTDGTAFTTLYQFSGDSDGSTPWAGVILSATTLYGTTGGGGNSFAGTVFAINTDGTGFTNLYSFGGGTDGMRPNASLLFSTNGLYGTTELGGTTPTNGVIFKLNTDGTGFQTLNVFSAGSYGSLGNLIISSGILYGTSFVGASGRGTVFAINIDGTGFTNLYSFTAGKGPQLPTAGLVLSGNVLYGTTSRGGTNNNGTVFALSLPSALVPQISVSTSSAGLVISWPANAPNLVLQSTTELGPSGIWTPVSTKPVVINGVNMVTNVFSGTQQFFRLTQ